MQKHRKHLSATIETLIIIVIACCMLFLNTFTTSKLNELENAGHNAVFIMDEVTFEDEEEFTEQIMQYLPHAYKMIELYDENLEILVQIQFSDEYVTKEDIHNYPDIVRVLKENEEGQTTITIGDIEQDVYFKWVTNTRGDLRLIIVYSTLPVVENIWFFSFVCYLVIILVFVLLIRLHSKSYYEKINQYKSMTKNLRNEFKR